MSSDDQSRESLQQHTQEFASRVSHDIDDSIASRQLGTMEESSLFGADLPSGQISLAQQFADPRIMRDAIILREIFQRPVDRWRFDEPMWGEVGDLE